MEVQAFKWYQYISSYVYQSDVSRYCGGGVVAGRYIAYFAVIIAFSGWFSGVAPANEITTYTYDALGRIVNSSTTGSVNGGLQTGISYDAAGNRSNYTVTGASPPTSAVLSIGNATVTEGSVMTFVVSRSGILTSPVSVQFASSSGTATTGVDFTAASGTVNFGVG